MTGRPKKFIPLEDIKGLKTLIKKEWTSEQIADYWKTLGIHVDSSTIRRHRKKIKGCK